MQTNYNTHKGTELTSKEAKEFEEAMANTDDFDLREEATRKAERELCKPMYKKGNEIVDCQGRLF